MPNPLTVMQQTLYAELIERLLDQQFDDDFPENGTFATRSIKRSDGQSRHYFYDVGYDSSKGGDKKQYSKYVGPADDKTIADRVECFKSIKPRAVKQRPSLPRSRLAV